ncbi:PQQ-binding-like beta-propeller repeat protein [Roseimaritima ulvae]|uniref:Outer membrane biogenesis protein BamB n=1 Tax=Roseimaritima ulvae TaxID=980254 RepID=A0A5B9QWS8_9BACT|nr:PQQ-binding-like beta-propeller repeat protein [Roseimaritima ulvae]QEG38411.1 outer membrane biogenesis protein BamB [Roseimaritima ulvae]
MPRSKYALYLCGLAVLGLSVARPGYGESAWPGFRGPQGNGHAARDARVPIDFGEQQGLVWKQPITGTGWSSPVIADGRIWLTTADTTEASEQQVAERIAADKQNKTKAIAGTAVLSVVCVDLETGQTLVQRTLGHIDAPEPIHATNSFASPTPVLRDGRLYCHFGTFGTWCLDADSGETIWENRIPLQHSVGPGSSPVLYRDRLILVCDGIDDQFIVALDAATGSVAWRTERPPIRAASVEMKKAYSTPLIIEVDGRDQAVIPGAQWICGYDPIDGTELWRVDHGSGFSTVPMAVYEDGLVMFATGFMKSELVAVDPTGSGDVSDTHVRWRMKKQAPTKPSPLAVDGRVYTISDSGVFCCTDIKTGELLYQKRVSGKYSASPLLAGGHIFLGNHEGVISVIRPGAEFEQVASIPLEGQVMASPVVAGDDLIIRTAEFLYRFTARD